MPPVSSAVHCVNKPDFEKLLAKGDWKEKVVAKEGRKSLVKLGEHSQSAKEKVVAQALLQ